MQLGIKLLLTGFLFISAFVLAQQASALSPGCEAQDTFNVGMGIHDITGPAAEEGMMGYAMINQKTAGILQRLWARAFIIESPCNGKRVVFVNTDLGQLFQGVKQQVIKKLTTKYGDKYQDANVLLTATHTHSGPGGYSTYAFYNLTTLGFSKENFNAIVNGIVEAISDANDHMQKGKMSIANGQLTGVTYNRSPSAYLLNPANERAKYDSDVDTTMTLIRFNDEAGAPLGLINWFPVHGVSLNNKNHLIDGDNKGYAEYFFEKEINTKERARPFVAAFAQTNAGDVSPNPLGHEGGNDEAGLHTLEQMGKPQYEIAKTLFAHAKVLLSGKVDYRHIYVTMDKINISPVYTHGMAATTCPAAIGISMLAGTQDGEGFGWQGIACNELSKLPLPKLVCESITTPCQGVKPIVITMGNMKPYPWVPHILPLQIIQVGQLIIVAVPFEVTTMTGRRIKERVAQTFPPEKYHIVLSTLANAYAGYVTTEEEYQAQRYEGASTYFGPWTAQALIQIVNQLSKALLMNETLPRGDAPPDLLDHQISLQTSVWMDAPPLGKQFGEVAQNVQSTYHPGDIVMVKFWGGHPKNDYHLQDTFLTVEKLMKDNHWKVIRDDNDWDTTYHWERSGFASSLITITWHIPKEIEKGHYRIVHKGNWKAFMSGNITPYQGISSVFEVI